jgi:hypothetical protein
MLALSNFPSQTTNEADSVMQGNVRSITVIRDLNLAVSQLTNRLTEISFDLRGEAQRAIQWVSSEAPQYWRYEQKLASQRLKETEDTLASMKATVGGRDKPVATELEQRVAKIRHRLQLCEEKLQLCKRWHTELLRAADPLLAAASAVQQQAETELPMAANQLDRLIRALEQYAEVAPANTSSSNSQNAEPADPHEPPA